MSEGDCTMDGTVNKGDVTPRLISVFIFANFIFAHAKCC